MNYIFFGIGFLAAGSLLILTKKFWAQRQNLVYKILSLILAGVFFIHYFANDYSLYEHTLGLNYRPPFNNHFLTVVVLLTVWLSYATLVILAMFPFFRKHQLILDYARTFCFISSVLSTFFLMQCGYTYTGTNQLSLGGTFWGLEIGICLAYSGWLCWQHHGFKMSKTQVINLLKALPIVLLAAAPNYVFSTFFGVVGSGRVKNFELFHRCYLYISLIFLLVMYFILHKRDKDFIRMTLLYISLCTLISFCWIYNFQDFVRPTSWPLHLCNTAMFLIPLCLMFPMKRLFYFTLFINVLGTLFAMFMPDYGDGAGFFNPSTYRFWINHMMAFAMPLLICYLGLYERPTIKQFGYALAGFAMYFITIIFINAWFTNFDPDIDFFFVNSDYVASKLGTWAKNIRKNITLTIPIGSIKLVLYPLYQFLFFLVYVAMGGGVWFIYAWVYQFQDFYRTLAGKNQKIKQDTIAMCVKYGEKEINHCMNKDSANKLVVKNVYKRYGNNPHYAVQDISFEVKAGEILGFLGPNGAGKSTIIKCIVGIQPPTSGSIEINGYDIDKQPVPAKMQFGFVPDHYALYEKLTSREYINYMADLYGVPTDVRNERLNKLMHDLSMEANIDNQIRTYSHGMKQKTTIMSALIHEPKLWILDEPLTGLDPNSIFEVKECMKAHARKGNIVFFSSHIIDIVEKLCDRIIIIKKGQIRASVTLPELAKQGVSLEQFYLNIINGPDDAPAEPTAKAPKAKATKPTKKKETAHE